jgi:septum formation protein
MSALILASTSVYRKSLIERLGIAVECIAPGVDEEAAKTAIADPVRLATTLAQAKARAVANRMPGRIVVAGDQLAAFRDRVLGKPGSTENAVEQLLAMSGDTHELITAMTVIAPSGCTYDVLDISRLTMRPLGRDQVERYVERDAPLDCAGSYKLEEAGIALFSAIESSDHTAITGLPMMALVRILSELGVHVP